MKRVIVVTDSTAGMPADLAAQNGCTSSPSGSTLGRQVTATAWT